MRIARLAVSNHQAIPDMDIIVREHLVVVGANESGKTSLLRLLDAVLSGSVGALYARIQPETLREPSNPLVVEVEFDSFTNDDKAALPDQIEVLPDGEVRLRLVLRATFDLTASEIAIERFFLKPGLRVPAKPSDLAQIGWAYLPAGRSPDRELGASRSSAVRNLLTGVELGESLAAIVEAVEALHGAVQDAPALLRLRESLAASLSELLPYGVTAEDLALALPAATETDPLADIDVKLNTAGAVRSLRDQSDGMRALSTVAIQLLAKKVANIIAVDEPEIHLHPRAQARVARLLRGKAHQSIVATHSPAVLAEYAPMHALSLTRGSCRQLPSEPFADDPKAAEHWWTTPALEPLTSRGVVLVEGVVDRVVVQGVARAMKVDLDRLGVVVASVNGAGGFKMALRLFGPDGFAIPTVGLVDLKEAKDVAGYMRIAVSGLTAAGVEVCDPDLEGVCVTGLGAARHASLLCASGAFQESRICSANSVNSISDLSDGAYADWCRRNKSAVAVALAGVLESADASQLSVLSAVVSAITSRI